MKSELACSFEEVRRERDGCRAALHEAAAEIERLRGEATQLRQAVGVLTTLHPTMEIDVNNPVQMALEIVSYVTESRAAEIERLRGQVEEAAIHIPAHAAITIEQLRRLLRDGLTSNVPEWKERVREALGEGNAT